jgi:DnaJ-class molecular chaperone
MKVDVIFLFVLTVSFLHAATLYDILEVPKDASEADIRKSYKRLALLLHPDKVPTDATDAQKDEMLKQFLDIQNAYEILGSTESRLKYDLSNEGIEYSTRETAQKERYKSRPFSMFIRTSKLKMLFKANFQKPGIPDININIGISITQLFNPIIGNVSFYRSVRCPSCGGNGGLNGNCSVCSLCGGAGHAQHMYHHPGDGFSQMTDCECILCKGKGCIPEGECPTCHGTGFIMQLSVASYVLPVGVRDGFVIVFENAGHEDLDGSIGRVNARFVYTYPPMWSADLSVPNSLNLVYTIDVKIEDLIKGTKRKFISVSGEEIEVFCANSF